MDMYISSCMSYHLFRHVGLVVLVGNFAVLWWGKLCTGEIASRPDEWIAPTRSPQKSSMSKPPNCSFEIKFDNLEQIPIINNTVR